MFMNSTPCNAKKTPQKQGQKWREELTTFRATFLVGEVEIEGFRLHLNVTKMTRLGHHPSEKLVVPDPPKKPQQCRFRIFSGKFA